jgi:hypothetical protein
MRGIYYKLFQLQYKGAGTTTATDAGEELRPATP